MDHRDLSEVNFGLIIAGRNPATLYKPEWFSVPYNKGVELLLQPGMTKEDVTKVISIEYMNDAHESVKRINGLGEDVDWPLALRKAATNLETGKKLQKIGKRLESNEDVDILPIYAELGSVITQEGTGLVKASEIDYASYKPFKLSGYEPLDRVIGGIPSDGPIIVYGVPGVGKSKFVTKLVDSLLHKHVNETASVYTLEMTAQHWLNRTVDLFPTMKDVLDRLYVSGSVKDIDELVAEVSQRKSDYVVLDAMDDMVKSSDASEYERIYRRVKEVCRFMGIPFFVLCQPNRAAKMAVEMGERFLGRYDVAWSGAAENSAALQIALQTTNALDMQSETFPTTDNNMDYIIVWKSRDGWLGDRDPRYQTGPGAICLEHTANWTGKPYGGKWRLHNPSSGKTKIGKKKKQED